MASDLNKVILIGRLTRDPELNYIQSGTAITKFSIANNRTYTASGEKKEQVSFFNCVAWAKLGEIITEYCKKGNRIAIEGRLQQRSWEDQNGNKRSTVEVVVDNFQFLTPKGSGDDFQSKGSGDDFQSKGSGDDFQKDENQPASELSDSSDMDNNPFSDDDIPF